MTALPLMAVLAFPVFAGSTYNGALQPYQPDTGNVEINFQTINQLHPDTVSGPSTYSGTAIFNMAVSNISGNPVDVSCSGVNLNISICEGLDITTCTWTDQAQPGSPYAVNMTSTAVAAGGNATDTQSFTVTSTTGTGWGAAISTSAVLPCTITDRVTSAVTTKIFYVPVS